MTHPKLILKRMQCYTIHIHLPSSKYALTRSYEFGHYRSFWKVTKNTFFVKASNLSMEYQNDMRPKGLIIRHINLSKRSKNTFKSLKLKKLCIVKVGQFLEKNAWSKYWPNLDFFQMGLSFQVWNSFLTWSTTSKPTHTFFYYLFYLCWYLIH